MHNPEILDSILESERRFNSECDAFHDRMMSMGVKAYRSNDGWVDRVNHNLRFFAEERTKGYYWGNLHLQKGDKIYIGDAHDEGKFAIIESVVDKSNSSAKYHYILVEEKPERKEGWFRRMIQRISKLI